jgi:hypothetical protein
MKMAQGRGVKYISRIVAENTALALQVAHLSEQRDDLAEIVREQRQMIRQLAELLLIYNQAFGYLYPQAYRAAWK